MTSIPIALFSADTHSIRGKGGVSDGTQSCSDLFQDVLTALDPEVFLAVAPLIVGFLFFQRYFVAGLVAGATKG